jgi:hypothetical protein
MTIDTDVAQIAAQFNIDPRLIQAVVTAEGDILKAVRCSLPETKTRAEAIRILCRSAVHALSDYVKAHCGPEFVSTWAERWAPQHASNDPRHLNANWPRNVIAGWLH